MREGWKVGLLGNFFEVVTGSTPPKNNARMFGDYMPLVKPPELKGGAVSRAEDGLSAEGAEVCRSLPERTILVSCIGQLGKVGISSVPLATNQQINAIKPNLKIAVPEFIYYQVMSPLFREQLNKLASGTTVPIVNKSKFSSIKVVTPPLPEQKRIVAILDEAFAGIETAIANTEKNLANARELFESHLNSVFSRRGDGWTSGRLGDYFEIVTGGTPPKSKPEMFGDYMPLVKPPELTDEEVSQAKEYLSIAGADSARVLPIGSVLVSCIGNLGKLGLTTVPLATNQQINAIKPEENKAFPKYVFYLAMSAGFHEQLQKKATGTTVSIVNKSKFSSIEISLPPLSEQEQIVESLDAIVTESKRLESIYQQKLTALAELKQSLLQKAFSGELTASKNRCRQQVPEQLL